MNPGGRAVRAVLLDADGVVQHAGPEWSERLTALAGPTFIAEAFAAERACLRGTADFREALLGVLHRSGVEADVDALLAIWQDVVVDAEVLDLVAEIRRAGIGCYLATNQHVQRGEHMRSTLGYERHFDDCFYSYRLGLAKPDPAYFRAIVAELGIPAGSAVFIDDVEANVRAAREAGLASYRHDPAAGVEGLRSLVRAAGVDLDVGTAR